MNSAFSVGPFLFYGSWGVAPGSPRRIRRVADSRWILHLWRGSHTCGRVPITNAKGAVSFVACGGAAAIRFRPKFSAEGAIQMTLQPERSPYKLSL